MRYVGTKATGIRLPIINSGDDLPAIITDYIVKSGVVLNESDVVGITEAIVAKSQGNYATVTQLATDIRQKYPNGQVGIVFPILSRNRFLNILKGVASGADEVCVLLSYPSDEVGNPIMDVNRLDEINDRLTTEEKPVSSAKFREIAGEFLHPFTNTDYIELYESVKTASGANVKVFFSNDPRDILKITPHALVADIHSRFLTQGRLKKAGAKTTFTLSDILAESVDGSGFNPDYGILGSNIATEDRLKLFPKNCNAFVEAVQEKIRQKLGVAPHVMIYGDGGFKDPVCGIWELADPVVSPGFTSGLAGQPHEIKIKMIADTHLSGMSSAEQQRGIKEIIRQKSPEQIGFNQEGTTPRRYTDLLGSLCDLMGGSGDKGTPIILVQGYFDNYADD
ncbi:MAG: coenzyme F420-0:L-glutamate ligase [Turicibacter sp.]|nr:coenzyme F420-0:L-glutamate ligase [Turicibacter sp.]